MSDDPRDLLTEAAPRPARPVDLGQVTTTARRRRVRTRALAATASVAVVAAAVLGVTSLSSGDSNSVAVRAGTPGTSDTPDGWTRVTVDGAGLSIAVPPGWTRKTLQDDSVLNVGGDLEPVASNVEPCTLNVVPLGFAGTVLSIYENPVTPGDGSAPVNERPTDFRAPGTATTSCGSANVKNAFAMFVFRDQGRVFAARVWTAGTTTPETEVRLAEQVLNTLRVEPATDATTTTGPSTTTEPATTTLPAADTTPTTAPPASSGSPADQQQIRQAFLGWLNGKTLDEAAKWIEDFPSIRDSEAQGIAQHTPEDLAGFNGRVESVVVADASHADVVYSLLNGGSPVYANRPGKAVKVNGKWQVTRDTACALLSMGGITCPTRTTPAP